jgi:hypothetical protein
MSQEVRKTLYLNDSPRPEGRGIVVLQGMDFMRVHTRNKQSFAGFKRPKGRGMDPPANQPAGPPQVPVICLILL